MDLREEMHDMIIDAYIARLFIEMTQDDLEKSRKQPSYSDGRKWLKTIVLTIPE